MSLTSEIGTHDFRSVVLHPMLSNAYRLSDDERPYFAQ